MNSRHIPARSDLPAPLRRSRLNPFQRLLLWPLGFYRRYLSPLKPQPTCRFHPTCSHYAVDAITSHGALRGSLLAVWRVLRCHPFNAGGFDPVPPVSRKPVKELPLDPEHRMEMP